MSASPIKSLSLLALASTTMLLAACGGGDSTDEPAQSAAVSTTPTSSKRQVTAPVSVNAKTPKAPQATSTPGTYTLQQRADAATAVAKTNAACTSLHPFYWEVGDKSGAKVSGIGGDNSVAPPNANTPMQVASASKWLFSTYVVEKQKGVLSTSDIKFLNFSSGYTNLKNCSGKSSVAGCLAEPGVSGGTNGDYVASSDGGFYYNGGHEQVLADRIGLGTMKSPALTGQVQSILGSNVAMSYSIPLLAGGAATTPAAYAQFLRNMIGGTYPHMLAKLGSSAICTQANPTTCPSAIHSPTTEIGNLAWHYSLGHWVENEPTTGDGAFSSSGKGGFYPWIDSTKNYYGVLASIDSTKVSQTSARPDTVWPVNCGRLIRWAWMNPDAIPAISGASR